VEWKTPDQNKGSDPQDPYSYYSMSALSKEDMSFFEIRLYKEDGGFYVEVYEGTVLVEGLSSDYVESLDEAVFYALNVKAKIENGWIFQ